VGQTAEEVRRDIERTRNDMGYTLDAMGDRVSPRRMVARRTSRFKGALRNARESVMGSAHHTASGAAGRVSGLASSAGEGLHGAGAVMASGADTALEMAKSAPEMARGQTEGNPIAAGVVAFGAGMLLGSLLPGTQQEQSVAVAMAPQLEPLKEGAQHLAQTLKASASEVASDAATALKDHAGEVGDQLKEQAQQTKAQVVEQ
jgi:hypothetical protein